MKTCIRCLDPKPLSQFRKKARNKDGHDGRCSACAKADAVRYYQTKPAYKQQIRAYQKRHMEKLRNWIWDYLIVHHCTDCGEPDAIVLEFDHVRGLKRSDISIMVQNRVPLSMLQEEVAKCDVVCANCHRRRTASRDGRWWKTKSL